MEIKEGDLVKNIGESTIRGLVGKVESVVNDIVMVNVNTGDWKGCYAWDSENVIVVGSSKDSPTRPSHYGKLDVFTYAKKHFTVEEVNAYHQITAIKYITRAGKKEGNPYEQDIKKAIVHLEECLKGEEG